MKNARKIMLCRWSYAQRKSWYYSPANLYPCILIKGRWFQEYGFTIGDQVTITNPKPGSLLMTVTKTAKQMQAIRDQHHENIKALVKEQRLQAA